MKVSNLNQKGFVI